MSSTASLADTVLAARSLLERQQWPEAEVLLRRLAGLHPDNEGIIDNLAWVLNVQDKFDEALDVYRLGVAQGIHRGNSDFDALYERALIATHTCPIPMRRRARFRRLLELLVQALDAPGCVAECGCFRGLSSSLMCHTLRLRDPAFSGQHYHIFDSFQGLSTPTQEDESAAQQTNACTAGAFAASLEEVRHNLRDFPAITYHPGWIPLTFQRLPESRYRFVHLDLDLYDPTLSALEYFYPRMAANGIIVCDDYDWPGERQAIEEFSSEQGARYTVTDSDQAVFVRS
jgi:predicted O-methyltransferase YrrM